MSDFFFKQKRNPLKHLCCPPLIEKHNINNPLLIYKFPCRIKLAMKINSSVGSSNHTQCYTVANKTLNAYGKWAGCPGGSGPGYSSTMRYVPNENVPGLGPTIGGSICNCDSMYSSPIVNISPPVISGNPIVGYTLSVNNGIWVGTPAVTFTYKWFGGTTSIPSATNNTYVTQSADVGQAIKCEVTGTNENGFVSVMSSNTITVIPPPPPSAPVNTVAPAISGSTPVGSTLTLTSTGTWTGYPAPTFTYQWFRGTTSISSATNNTYVTQSADVGQQVKCRVTGTNTSGSSFADSNTIMPTNV